MTYSGFFNRSMRWSIATALALIILPCAASAQALVLRLSEPALDRLKVLERLQSSAIAVANRAETSIEDRNILQERLESFKLRRDKEWSEVDAILSTKTLTAPTINQQSDLGELAARDSEFWRELEYSLLPSFSINQASVSVAIGFLNQAHINFVESVRSSRPAAN